MYKLLLVTLCTFSFIMNAQTVRFKHEFQFQGQSYSNTEGGIVQLPDSGFLVTSKRGVWPDSGFALLRLDKWGDLMWTKNYNLPFFVSSPVLIKHTINDYSVFCGLGVVRIDSSGNVIWAREINPGFSFCAPTQTGGLVFEGQSSDSTVIQNITVGKMDAAGNMLWTTGVDSLVTNGIHGIIAMPLSNGGEQYIMLGTTYWEYGYYDVITCVSETGELLWNKLTHYFIPMDMAIGPDQDLYLTGYADHSQGNHGIMVLKMNEQGQFTSTKSLGPLDPAWSKITISGDSLLLTGNFSEPNNFDKHYCVCVDTGLNIIWQRKVSGGSNTYLNVGRKAILTSDGGYAHVAVRQAASNASYYLTVIKGDQNGNAQCYESNLNLSVGSFTWIEVSDSVVRPFAVVVTPMSVVLDTTDVNRNIICSTVGIEESDAGNRVSMSPNPVNDYLTLQFSDDSQPAHLVIVNSIGQTVLKIDNYYEGQRISCAELVAGSYVILVNNMALEDLLIVQH